MFSVLDKQIQRGENRNLTKRKQGCATIGFPNDHPYVRLQIHLGKHEVMQTRSLHSEKPPMTPECLGGQAV